MRGLPVGPLARVADGESDAARAAAVTNFFGQPEPVGASRVKGAHVTLRRLRFLRARIDKIALANLRTLRGRRLTTDTRAWLARTHDVLCDMRDDLKALIADGEAVVPAVPEPRIDQRARKGRDA